MKLSKKAIGNLINKYRAVISKCRLVNALGTLAVAGVLLLGTCGIGMADSGIKRENGNNRYGAYNSLGDSTGGDVYIDTGNPDWNIYGGFVGGSFGVADNNSVTMTNGNASSIYGGSTQGGDATNNTVFFSGGKITEDLYGGQVVGSGNATNNTVIFSGGEVKNLHGGVAGGTSGENTLVVIGKQSVGGNVSGFQHYRFLLPANVATTDKMLTVNGSAVNITGASVGVAFSSSPSNFQIGDSVTLINKTNGASISVVKAADAAFLAPITVKGKSTITQKYGFLTNYDFDVFVESSGDNPLKATLAAITQSGNNPYVNNGDGLNDYIKAAQDRGEISPAFSTDPSKPGGVQFLSRAMDPAFGNGSTESAKAVESAMNSITVAAVPQMTMGANMAAVGAVTQRTSIAMPMGNMQSATLVSEVGDQSGLNAGDELSGLSAGNKYDKTGFALWIMPLWQSNNTFGMNVGDNLEADTYASIGGIAIGADYTWDQMFRLGLTFNIGGGYASGSGDFATTTNNMNFWGIGAYAGLAYNNFGLTADVNYTSSYNKIKQEIYSGLQMGDFKSDVQSSAISVGLRGEYQFETSALDITPHIGVRFMYLTTDDYDMKSGGKTVLKADSSHQSIWTFPIGVQFAKSFDMNNGWYVKPSLDLSIIPAAGDIEAKRDVRFTGVSGTLSPEAQTMDWVSYSGLAGLEFGNDNVKLGLNYNLQLGAHSTNHGLFGTFRYEF